LEADSRDRSRRGRSKVPESLEAEGELESPRLNQPRPHARTVVGAGIKLGRIASQGGARSVVVEDNGRKRKVGQQQVFVGVDVSKERLDVAVRPRREQWSEAKDAAGVKRLVKRLEELNCMRIVIEATAGYETLLVSALWTQGLAVTKQNRHAYFASKKFGKLTG
jgi:hypothetical protein